MLIFTSGCSKSVVQGNYKQEEMAYYGYLEIPSINMRLGFYNYDHLYNDVAKNIMFINTGIKDTYVLAGHSGSNHFALFNDLRYVLQNDTLILEIGNQTNKYLVKYIKREIKDGSINIPNESGWLILTTCDQEKKGYQLIIAGKIV